MSETATNGVPDPMPSLDKDVLAAARLGATPPPVLEPCTDAAADWPTPPDGLDTSVAPAADGSGAAPPLLVPRSGHEADWPTPSGGLDKSPDFGSWPKSQPMPARKRRPLPDLIVTGLIALVVATAAAAYITSGFRFSHPQDTHPKRTAPLASGSDPFAPAP
jgi:hypothetical protein